jgi:hypothetical protein
VHCKTDKEWTLFTKNRDQLAAIRSFRAYHNQAQLWPGQFRLARRATVYRHLAAALSSSLKTQGTQGNITTE